MSIWNPTLHKGLCWPLALVSFEKDEAKCVDLIDRGDPSWFELHCTKREYVTFSPKKWNNYFICGHVNLKGKVNIFVIDAVTQTKLSCNCEIDKLTCILHRRVKAWSSGVAKKFRTWYKNFGQMIMRIDSSTVEHCIEWIKRSYLHEIEVSKLAPCEIPVEASCPCVCGGCHTQFDDDEKCPLSLKKSSAKVLKCAILCVNLLDEDFNIPLDAFFYLNLKGYSRVKIYQIGSDENEKTKIRGSLGQSYESFCNKEEAFEKENGKKQRR